MNEVEHFRRACIDSGIYIERCGLAVRDLLIELRSGPLAVAVSSYGGMKTPRGETWLTELEIHGLIGAVPVYSKKQKGAAQ